MTRLPFFVYGTLRTGFGNHRTFGQSVRDVKVAHLDRASMVTIGFPYVWRTATGRIVGELITVDEAQYEQTQSRLDSLEGYRGPGKSNHYDRTIVDVVITETGETVQAYTYLVDAATAHGLIPVPSGDFADTLKPTFDYSDPFSGELFMQDGQDIEIGDDVVWTDPDGAAEKAGTVIDTYGDMFLLTFPDGGEAEVLFEEMRLSPLVRL